MNIIERRLNDVIVLELDGNLASEGNVQFRKCVTATIDAGTRKLVINMARVEYMDSTGLDELVSCYAKLYRMRGRLKLLHPSNRLQYVLTITKLNYVFETFSSESAAVASFNQ